jgi:hypothetical protein
MYEIGSTLTRGATTSSALIVGLERVAAALEQRGVPLPNSGRVPTYIRTLKRLRRKPALLEGQDATDYLIAMVEGQYVLDAYAGLIYPPEVSGWQGKFMQALKGRPELVAEDKSRDTMMELVVAAAAHRGGLEVHLDEPDIRIVHEGRSYGVAAKRIRSLKKLGGRVREGAGQVERVGLSGFVTVDLTVALGFHEGIVLVPRIDDAEKVVAAARQKIAEELPDSAMAAWLRDKPMIAGIVGFAYVRGVLKEGANPLIFRLWVQRPRKIADPLTLRFFLNLPSRLDVAGADDDEGNTSKSPS